MVAASWMLQHPLCFTQTHSVSCSFAPSHPATVWQTSLCPLTTAGLSHRSLQQPSPFPPPSKFVDFTYFVWEGGKESSGLGGLQGERERHDPAKGFSEATWRLASVPLNPQPDRRGTEGQWIKEKRWNLMERFPMTGANTDTVTE